MLKKYSAQEIADFLNARLIGDNILITEPTTLEDVKSNCVTFISKETELHNVQDALFIVDPAYKADGDTKNSYILVENPRLAFAYILDKYFVRKYKHNIPRSSTIGTNVIIKENVVIGENVIIEDDVFIGNNSRIDHGVIIYSKTTIGNHCLIEANSVIGNSGLGEIKIESGEYYSMPHVGGVQIADNVKIGSNCTIGRGVISNTIIGYGTKLGPQVNIGHNCLIGNNCLIAGRTHISGSVKIGYSSKLWANCTIKDGISIGDNCTVGIGAIVTNDIESDIMVMGLEALKLKSLVKFKKDTQYK